MRFRPPLSLFALLLAAAQFGCQKEQQPQSTEPAASVEKPTTIDPALAKAVAAASAAGRAAPASSGGPPQRGVFAPGDADRQIKKGAPPILTLGSNGSEPRVTIGPLQPKPGWKTSGSVQVAVQGDARQGALPIDLGVTIEAQKPKSAETTDAGAAPVSVAVVAKITSARIGVTGVPPELASRVEKLKGSRVEYEVFADGSGTGYRQVISAGAEEARDQLRVLSDMLALVTLPVPNQPLGQGAYWLATSREGVFGLDLVTYRMVKVEAASESGVTLSVNTKRYATSNKFDFQGLPPDAPHDLVEFESKSDGRLVFRVGAPFPESGEVQSLLAASLAMAGQQRGMLQIQSRVGLDFGGKAPGAAPK